MVSGFLLDEHLPSWWRKEITKREPVLEIWRVGDPLATIFSSTDPEILKW